jgi:uncharacterized protein (TIGR02646 family)
MIKLERKRTKQAIPAAYRGERRVMQIMTLLVEPGMSRTLNEKYWKGAKKQLKAESGGKCCYCEAPTELVAHGDVEHFRPKSVYWWLAYCYDNYLYSCQICNQTYKGDAFPVDARMAQPDIPANSTPEQRRAIAALCAPDPFEEIAGLGWKDFAAAMLAEGALLPNPYFEDPEELFVWDADPVLKEVSLRPRPGNPRANRVAAAVEQYLGLNREELRRWRWRIYVTLDTFRAVIDSGRIDDTELRRRIQDTVRAMVSGEDGFTGMCRYYVRDQWKLPLEG